MLSDYHIHTHFSTDSEEEPRLYIERAIELGMKEICFTDHIDYDYPEIDGKKEFIFNPDAYFAEFSALRDEYRDRLKIKIGVETGLNPVNSAPNRKLLDSYPFDFVIGSSHIMDGIDPYYPDYWTGKNPSDVIRHYYESILEMTAVYDDYDVYGHLDYIKRYVTDPDYVYIYSDIEDIMDMLHKNIIEKGRGIELKTRGLSNGITSFVPTIALLERYHSLGGEIITLGSDAHRVPRLGFGFRTARDILINTGFKYIAAFEQRKATFVPID